MVWDTLYGAGDPNGWVNGNIATAIAEWKAGARGVILDHRAGSGGTLDAAENLTKLVRAPEPVAVVRMPIIIGGWDGPADDAEGLSIFTQYKDNENTAFQVGSVDHDPTLPVALITHRDGSASDYLPFGMKGAPKVKIFGPHGTAGAFSTFIEFHYWAGLSFQIASGETIAYDGRALIGHGVEPDVVLLPRQSDLLAGKDTLHEAALAWVRQELKP
jgi:C-terminal processing protease CtpA/Prc